MDKGRNNVKKRKEKRKERKIERDRYSTIIGVCYVLEVTFHIMKSWPHYSSTIIVTCQAKMNLISIF